MESKSKISTGTWILVIAFIIILIVVYIGTLGQVNISNIKAPNGFKDNLEEAKQRHKALKAAIENKKTLKLKLQKRFKISYFFVRFGLILLWAAYIFGCYKLQWVNNLEDILNFSEAAILLVVALNFLTFGTLSSLNGFIGLIKMKLENWVWGKYININEDIAKDKAELVLVENEISSINA